MLAWIGGKAMVKAPATYRVLAGAKDVALFVAAPFIGLVYAVTLPFVGTALIARASYKAYRAWVPSATTSSPRPFGRGLFRWRVR
jgi:hypothetical protein